ncbi:MAG: hypothetical protein OXM54_06545 [Acidimicrobiaceae bacterium]|nr:hypothetical protein [Acidimicrobiaceae bacterium]
MNPTPAAIVVNVPAGASARPDPPLPQQVTVASAHSPHVCEEPAEIAVNVPSGGYPCGIKPNRESSKPYWKPQQRIVASVRSPQLCELPAVMAVYVIPGATSFWPKSVRPQQAALPLGRSPHV